MAKTMKAVRECVRAKRAVGNPGQRPADHGQEVDQGHPQGPQEGEGHPQDHQRDEHDHAGDRST